MGSCSFFLLLSLNHLSLYQSPLFSHTVQPLHTRVNWPDRRLTGLCGSQSVLPWLQIEPTSRPHGQRVCCLHLVLTALMSSSVPSLVLGRAMCGDSLFCKRFIPVSRAE